MTIHQNKNPDEARDHRIIQSTEFEIKYWELKREISGTETAVRGEHTQQNVKRSATAKKRLQSFYLGVMQSAINNRSDLHFLCHQATRPDLSREYNKDMYNLLQVVALHRRLQLEGVKTRLPTLEERLGSKADLIGKNYRPIICRWYSGIAQMPETRPHALAIYESIAGFNERFELELAADDRPALKIRDDLTKAKNYFKREPLLVQTPRAIIDSGSGLIKNEPEVRQKIIEPLLKIFE